MENKKVLKYFNKIVICIGCLFLCSIYSVKAQVWNLRAGIGTIGYAGDLSASPLSNSHFALRIGVGAEVLPRLAFQLSYLSGNVSAKDQIVQFQKVNFTSPIDNINLLVKYRLDKMNFYVNRWGLAVLFGGGYVVFEPSEKIQGTEILLQELRREGVAYDQSALEFNLGGELAFMITRKWILTFQSVYHITGTDYLDDVSLRKNANNNDNYLDNTIGLTYRFGRSEAFLRLQSPMNCPAFLR